MVIGAGVVTLEILLRSNGSSAEEKLAREEVKNQEPNAGGSMPSILDFLTS